MNVLKSLLKNCVSFLLFLLIITQHVFLCKILWYIYIYIYILDVFLIFITKNTSADGILFQFLWMSLVFTGNEISKKSGLFGKSLWAF